MLGNGDIRCKHILSSLQAAPVLDDEMERNNLLQVQDELRKLGTDRERRDYFHKKHSNSRRADPAENLSSFSWRSPVEEGAALKKGKKNVAINRDDILRNDSKTVNVVFDYKVCH